MTIGTPRRSRFAAGALAALAAAPAFAPAQDLEEDFRASLPPQLRLLTSEIGDDYSPSLSSEEEWMAFVSERDGSPEIFITRFRQNVPVPPSVIEPSPAEDRDPVISPDDKWIAWVSTREDAFGDIYVQILPFAEPFFRIPFNLPFIPVLGKEGAARVSERGWRDRNPRWETRDGDLYLVWDAESPDGTVVVKEARPGRWRVQERPSEAATSVQNLVPPFGATVVEPPERGTETWVLAADDTDGDGSLTAEDARGVWVYDEERAIWRQLTPPLPGVTTPLVGNLGSLVMSVNLRGNRDLVEVERPYFVSRVESAGEALERGRQMQANSPLNIWPAVAVFRQGYLLGPETTPGQQALLEALGILDLAERPEQALAMIGEARTRGGLQGEERQLIEIFEVAFRVSAADRGNRTPSETRQVRREAITELEALIAGGGLTPRARGRALLVAARVAEENGQPKQALDFAQLVEADNAIPVELRGESALLRAGIYRGLGLPDDVQRVLLNILREYATLETAEEQAALMLTEVALETATGASLDEKLRPVRALASAHPDLDSVQVAASLAAGNLLADEVRFEEAEEALRTAMTYTRSEPRLAARAAFDLAQVLSRQNEFAEAIETYESVSADMRSQFFAGAPSFIRRAREALINEYLQKGDYELRVGDPALALRTFSDLLELEPELTEGWRGFIDAQFRLGILDSAAKARYRREALANLRSGLAQYKYGLAITYPEPTGASRDILERAIVLDGANPYFHQTLGFVLEWQGRRGDRENLARALTANQRALALLDRRSRPADYANLLLNAGNVAGALQSYGRAADLYTQRVDSGVPFRDTRTEFLFYYNYGEALFQASRPLDAAEAWQTALVLIPALVNYNILTPEQGEERQLELYDRRALALREAGRRREAAELFDLVAQANLPQSFNRARAYRNKGFTLHLLSQRQTGAARRDTLLQAKKALEQALAIVTSEGLTLTSLTGTDLTPSFQFGFDITISAGGSGAALQDFSPEEEEQLIRAGLARVTQDLGQHAEAIAQLRQQLSNRPKVNAANKGYYRTVRLVNYESLANEYLKLGEREEAAKALVQAIDEAYFTVKDLPQVNGAGLSLVLGRLTEMALDGEPFPVSADELKETWLGERFRGEDPVEALDWCLEQALALRGEETGEYIVFRYEYRGRLQLARALLAERSAVNLGEEGLPLLRSAVDGERARILAQQLIDNSLTSEEGGSVEKLALFAHAVLIRAAARSGSVEDTEAAVESALNYARQAGWEHFQWWLAAQPALIAGYPQTVESVRLALEQLEAQTPGVATQETPVPYDLLAYCEQVAVSAAAREGDWNEAWGLAERWRAMRLQLGFTESLPPARESDTAGAEWLATARTLKRATRDKLVRLRDLPYLDPNVAQARRELAEARNAWVAHLNEGRDAGIAAALMIAPRASYGDGNTPIEFASQLFDFGLALPGPPALVLVTREGAAAWADPENPTQARPLASPADWDWLARQATVWFVSGEPLSPGAAPETVTVSRLLNAEMTAEALRTYRFDVSPEPVAVAAPERTLTSSELRQRLLDGPDIELTAPILTNASDPLAWTLEGSELQLRGLVAALPDVAILRATLKEATGTRKITANLSLRHRINQEFLAAAMFYGGVTEAMIDGERWLGAIFSPVELRELAEQQDDADVGTVIGRLESGETAEALAPAQRLFSIRQTLEKSPQDVAEAGLVLAQIEADLDRYAQAADAAARVVNVLEGQDAEPATLVNALDTLASYATRARDFDQALEAKSRSASLYEQLGALDLQTEAIAEMGVLEENRGNYEEALSQFRRARQMAADFGDPYLEAKQYQRIGRIYLLRQNDYVKAGEAFAQARELASAAQALELELESRLDLARVDARLGRFDAAIETARAVREDSRDASLPVVETDGLLVEGETHWAKADYFEAFQRQREALLLAQETDDQPNRFRARNFAGLIYWALNDTEAALAEFDEALRLAREMIFDLEVATAHNNRGLVFRSMKQYPRALVEFNAALAIDRRQGNDWGVAYAQRNIGLTHLQDEKPEQSVAPLEEAVALTQKIGDELNGAKALVALADARRQLGETEAASDLYDRALEKSRTVIVPEVEWRALYGMAKLAMEAGEPQEARARLGEAIDVVERLRARIRIEEFQDGFLLDKQELYDDMVRLLLDQDDVAGAYNYSERSRGRQFLDLLGNASIDFRNPQDTATIEREAALRSDIESLERQVAGAEDEAARERLAGNLESARRDYSAFLIELRARDPKLSSFVEVPTLDVAELQRLLEPGTRIVEYHVLPDELVAWVVGPNDLRVVRTPVTRDELTQDIGVLRLRMQDFRSVANDLMGLSALLIEPVLPLLDGDVKRLGIVAHRELHTMPFSALPAGPESDLIDRFALFNAPSASVLRYTFGRRGEGRGDRVLALGNPNLGDERLDLPFAQKEAERLLWQFPNATLLTGEEASETYVQNTSDEFAILHLATHGEFDPQMPLLSGVRLTPDTENDGVLSAQEVFGLSLRADMVVLSACQTGLGRVSNGDDVVGLNRAFLFAGTRQLLSTLWRVDDVSTAVLVKHFYRNLSAGMDTAEALRQAQLTVRQRFDHPAHWAGMNLTGDWK
ncbi:MAG: CHAT domain-containing protein [Sumerlaeia bacterium]